MSNFYNDDNTGLPRDPRSDYDYMSSDSSLLDRLPDPHDIPLYYVVTDSETGERKVDYELRSQYEAEYKRVKDSSEETLKGYYDSVFEAQYYITSYIVCLDHATESFDFAIRQFNFAKDILETFIDDGEIEPKIKKLSDNIDTCNDLKRAIQTKRDIFLRIQENLEEYVKKIITKNNMLKY